MKNIKSILSSHKMKVLNNTVEIEDNVNSRSKNNCPKYHLQSTDHVKPAQL